MLFYAQISPTHKSHLLKPNHDFYAALCGAFLWFRTGEETSDITSIPDLCKSCFKLKEK